MVRQAQAMTSTTCTIMLPCSWVAYQVSGAQAQRAPMSDVKPICDALETPTHPHWQHAQDSDDDVADSPSRPSSKSTLRVPKLLLVPPMSALDVAAACCWTGLTGVAFGEAGAPPLPLPPSPFGLRVRPCPSLSSSEEGRTGDSGVHATAEAATKAAACGSLGSAGLVLAQLLRSGSKASASSEQEGSVAEKVVQASSKPAQPSLLPLCWCCSNERLLDPSVRC